MRVSELIKVSIIPEFKIISDRGLLLATIKTDDVKNNTEVYTTHKDRLIKFISVPSEITAGTVPYLNIELKPIHKRKQAVEEAMKTIPIAQISSSAPLPQADSVTK